MPYDYRGPRRRTTRLHGYDYAQAGMYFVTICSFQNRHFFGEIINGEMILNDFGKIVLAEWENLPTRWPHLELGVYQVMPNHFHAILVVHRPVGMVLKAEQVMNGTFRVRATLAVAPKTANGTTANGTTANGTTANGTTANGTTANGTTANGTTANGTTANGTTANGTTANGTTANGTTANGTTANGTTANGTTARVAPTDNPADAVPETQFRYMNVSMMNVNGTPKIRITKNDTFEQTIHNNKLPNRPDFRVRATLAVAPGGSGGSVAPGGPGGSVAPGGPGGSVAPGGSGGSVASGGSAARTTATKPEAAQIQIIPFTKAQWATRPTLGQIIGAFKSRVETECLKWFKQNHPGERMGKIWHRSYFDIIIRDAIAFRNITWYIINNPKNWRKDKFFTTQ